MKKKILNEYIINICISLLLAISGLLVFVSTLMEGTKLKAWKENLSDNNGFESITETLVLAGASAANDITRYFFGYPPLMIGIISFLLSTVAAKLCSRKFTEKTTGYKICMIISYVLIFLLIGFWLITAINIFLI